MSDQSLKLPKPSGRDAIIAVLRAGTGSIPIAGAAATELFNWFVKSPIENRRDEWMKQVGEELEELKTKHGIDLELLQTDQGFVDVLMQATHIAMRNHQEEKRNALRNAIANSAGPHAPEQSKRQMFLHFIDIFTVWHLRLLNLFANPRKWFEGANIQPPIFATHGPISQIVTTAFPELDEQSRFYIHVFGGLKDAGLVEQMDLKWATNAEGSMSRRTTNFGDEFLKFIEKR